MRTPVQDVTPEIRKEVERDLARARRRAFADTETVDLTFSRSKSRYSRLDFKTLKDTYRRSYCIRDCVEKITTQITALGWTIKPVEELDEQGKKKQASSKARRAAAEANKFLKRVNANQEHFRFILNKTLKDLLIYDQLAIEKVFSLTGNLVELWARNGSTFTPKTDPHGVITGYIQKMDKAGETATVEFAPYEVVYMIRHMQTDSSQGLSLIDSVVDEVAALLSSSDKIAASFTEDEIPPGILAIGKIGEEAYKRAKEEFVQGRGDTFRLRVIRNAGDVEWINLTRSLNDMQTPEIRDQIDKIVYRLFGFTDIEAGRGANISRGAAKQLRQVGQSQLTVPLAQMISTYLNIFLFWPHFSDEIEFHFNVEPIEDLDELGNYYKGMVSAAIITRNEARMKRGFDPVPGGDIPFVIIGNSLIKLEDLEKIPSGNLMNLNAPEGKGKGIDEDEDPDKPPGGGDGKRFPAAEEKDQDPGYDREKLIDHLRDRGLLKTPEELNDSQIEFYNDVQWEVRYCETALERHLLNASEAMQRYVREHGSLTRSAFSSAIETLNEKWEKAFRKHRSKAIKIGMKRVKEVFDLEDVGVSEEEMLEQQIEKDMIYAQGFFDNLQQTLIENDVLKKQLESEAEEAVAQSFASHGRVSSSAAGRVWSSGSETFERAAVIKKEEVWWVDVADKFVCEDCIELAAGSPYKPGQLGTRPGEGETRCGGSCRCIISIERELSEKPSRIDRIDVGPASEGHEVTSLATYGIALKEGSISKGELRPYLDEFKDSLDTVSKYCDKQFIDQIDDLVVGKASDARRIFNRSCPARYTGCYWHDGKLFYNFHDLAKYGARDRGLLLYHEIAHSVQRSHGLHYNFPLRGRSIPTQRDSYKVWKRKHRKEGARYITNYARKDLAEDFAETFSYYIMEPELLKRVCPGKYQFMKDSVFGGKEFIK
jgi:hypothetical protein